MMDNHLTGGPGIAPLASVSPLTLHTTFVSAEL